MEQDKTTGKKKDYDGMYMCLGIVFGVAIGLVTGDGGSMNITVMCMGMVLGIAVDMIIAAMKKKKNR